jgi:hypothetical protein
MKPCGGALSLLARVTRQVALISHDAGTTEKTIISWEGCGGGCRMLQARRYWLEMDMSERAALPFSASAISARCRIRVIGYCVKRPLFSDRDFDDHSFGGPAASVPNTCERRGQVWQRLCGQLAAVEASFHAAYAVPRLELLGVLRHAMGSLGT